jgi:threonine/homoserine/homoserine lactone efflux protein
MLRALETRKFLPASPPRAPPHQIAISVSVNALIALTAGSIALFLGNRPTWLLVQRWLMGTVLAGLALRMAFEAKRA